MPSNEAVDLLIDGARDYARWSLPKRMLDEQPLTIVEGLNGAMSVEKLRPPFIVTTSLPGIQRVARSMDVRIEHPIVADVGGTLRLSVTLDEEATPAGVLGDVLNHALTDGGFGLAPGARYRIVVERLDDTPAPQVTTYRVGAGLRYEIDRLEGRPQSRWRPSLGAMALVGFLLLAAVLYCYIMATAHGVKL